MFSLLVLVGLFVALTPGILFRLKGTKMVSAAMHAVLFAFVLYELVSTFGFEYDVSYEGFQTDPPPICPNGISYDNGLCKTRIVCPSGHKFSVAADKCIKAPNGGPQKASCPANTILHDNGMCYDFTDASCPSGLRQDRDFCVVEPTCPDGLVFNGADCKPPSPPPPSPPPPPPPKPSQIPGMATSKSKSAVFKKPV